MSPKPSASSPSASEAAERGGKGPGGPATQTPALPPATGRPLAVPSLRRGDSGPQSLCPSSCVTLFAHPGRSRAVPPVTPGIPETARAFPPLGLVFCPAGGPDSPGRGVLRTRSPHFLSPGKCRASFSCAWGPNEVPGFKESRFCR